MVEPNQPRSIQAHIEGNVTGQVAIGNNILQIGPVQGGVVNVTVPEEALRPRPRPTPVLLRPRPFPGLLDRKPEVRAAALAFDTGLPVAFHGEAGLGKTTLLRHLAYHPGSSGFRDGVVYLSARHQPMEDVAQSLWDAFYETSLPYKATGAALRHSLQDKQALVLLDDVEWPREDVERLMDVAPACIFLLASTERRLFGEVRAMALGGLPLEDALALVERTVAGPLTDEDRSGAEALCVTLAGHPLRLLQALALAQDDNVSLQEIARRFRKAVSPDTAISQAQTSRPDSERRLLGLLAFLGGAFTDAEHLNAITGASDVRPALEALQLRSLVQVEKERYGLVRSLVPWLEQELDAASWLDKALTHFTSWAEAHRNEPQKIVGESTALMKLLEASVATRRWADLLRLARVIDGAFALVGRWGAWSRVLQMCLQAARVLGDKADEAWSLHQVGTRALCLDDSDAARDFLARALEIRQFLGDELGSAVTQHNLDLLLSPLPVPQEKEEGEPTEELKEPQSKHEPEPIPEPKPRGLDQTLVYQPESPSGPEPAVTPPKNGGGFLSLAKLGLFMLVVTVSSFLLWWVGPWFKYPLAQVSPPSLAFVNQQVATRSTAQTLSVANHGNGPMEIASVSLEASAAADFGIVADNCSGTSVAPDSSCTVLVHFNPRATGDRSAALAISYNAEESPFRVPLRGTGTEPLVSLEPTALEFGDLLVASSSRQKRVTLRNNGTGPLRIQNVSTTEEDPRNFNLQGNTCTGASLAPNETCRVSIVFSPRTTGRRQASLTISHNAPGESHNVLLSGTGTEAVARLSSNRLDFGPRLLGTRSEELSLWVANEGTGPLIIADEGVERVGGDLDDFTQAPDTCSGATLDPGETCSIRISFAPAAVGSRETSLRINHNAGEGSSLVSLTGAGTIPVARISSARVDFGDQLVGLPGDRRPITLTNEGSGPLSVTSIEFHGENRGDFTIVRHNCLGTAIAPRSQCTIEVQFSPTAAGRRRAELILAHNAARSPHNVLVFGRGTRPLIELSALRLDFGEQLLLQRSEPREIRIANVGTGKLTVRSIDLVGEGANDFSLSHACSSIDPDRSCKILVAFEPSRLESRNAAIDILHSAEGSPQRVMLTGLGTQPIVDLRPAKINFGDQLLRTRSKPATIEVANQGSGPLIIEDVRITGDTSHFAVERNLCRGTVLNPGRSCTIEAVFAPLSLGSLEAILSIAHNGPDGPHRVLLAGKATALSTECPDPAAVGIEFGIVSRASMKQGTLGSASQRFRGTVRITGVVKNVGQGAYESGREQQEIQLLEISLGSDRAEVVARRDFRRLAPGQEAAVQYEREWDASSPAEGEFPPVYRLVIVYRPDIRRDENRGNDDCDLNNNRMERSGSEINELFRR